MLLALARRCYRTLARPRSIPCINCDTTLARVRILPTAACIVLIQRQPRVIARSLARARFIAAGHATRSLLIRDTGEILYTREVSVSFAICNNTHLVRRCYPTLARPRSIPCINCDTTFARVRTLPTATNGSLSATSRDRSLARPRSIHRGSTRSALVAHPRYRRDTVHRRGEKHAATPPSLDRARFIASRQYCARMRRTRTTTPAFSSTHLLMARG